MVRCATLFVIVWIVAFVVGLLLDEDVNHWDWPSDAGPGARATARIGALCALVAAVPAAAIWLLGL